MPFRIDWTISANYLVMLLVIISIMAGIIVALQGFGLAAVSDIVRRVDTATVRIDRTERDFDAFRRSQELFQSELRQNLLELSNSISAVKEKQERRR